MAIWQFLPCGIRGGMRESARNSRRQQNGRMCESSLGAVELCWETQHGGVHQEGFGQQYMPFCDSLQTSQPMCNVHFRDSKLNEGQEVSG